MSHKEHCTDRNEHCQNVTEMPENNSGNTLSKKDIEVLEERDRLLKENYDLHLKLLARNIQMQQATVTVECECSTDDGSCPCATPEQIEQIKERRNKLLKENFDLHISILTKIQRGMKSIPRSVDKENVSNDDET